MIVIYGASDDLIEVEGSTRDEFYANSDDEGLLRITRDNGQGTIEGLMVAVRYEDNGCWSVAPFPLEEGWPLPWPVSLDLDGYTARLTVESPDDVEVVYDGKDTE